MLENETLCSSGYKKASERIILYVLFFPFFFPIFFLASNLECKTFIKYGLFSNIRNLKSKVRLFRYYYVISWKTYGLFIFEFKLIGSMCKGQLISKCPFGVIVWTKIPTKKFDKFCPRVYKVVKSTK